MHTLFSFIRVFREYIVLTALAGLSILLIAYNDSAPVQLLRSASLVSLASLQSSSNWATSLFSSQQNADALRDVNVALMEEVMQLRRLRQENMELRRKIGFRDRSTWPLVPAEIVGKNLTSGQNMITLDVGRRDSIEVNMPVINEEGLVGKIVATSERHSIAMLAVNRGFRATAKIKRSRIDGIIAWDAGEYLLLRNVRKSADALPGDTIVTSEYSNIFPPEIMIGIIRDIGPSEDGGPHSRIEVEARVNFAALERVFVVRYSSDPLRDAIERELYQPTEITP
ncbi:MAG: rod shape-determining protein MreC [Bacteroidetes bacterium]|nr:rod shape-determining protein MreC [Bacteroidota bacterium]